MGMTTSNLVAMKQFTFGRDKTWSSVASTSAEQTVTVPGLRLGDFVTVSKPTLQAGLSVGSARVSAADTLAITLITSGATVTPTALEVWSGVLFRPDFANDSAMI